jgi:hypothetical protein
MRSIDLKKELKHLYQPKRIEAVEVPGLDFVMIDGAIEPEQGPGTSPLFQENMSALYGMAYTLKFLFKKRPLDPVDYPVMALEGLWWVEDGHFDLRVKDNWLYTIMILVPDVVTPAAFEQALAQMKKKKGDQPAFARLRLERFTEGLCVQAMHLGPYASEPETLDGMHAFMAGNGYRDRVGLGGKHHEIYLGDPRQAAPEKLKTVLRHPVEKV